MSYLIKNTVWDRSKAHLHRKAAGLIYTPSIGGKVLRENATMELDDDHFEQNRHMLEGWEKKGMIEITKVGEEKAKAAAPPVPVSEVDKAVEDATTSEKPFIAEQLAAEQKEEGKKGRKKGF